MQIRGQGGATWGVHIEDVERVLGCPLHEALATLADTPAQAPAGGPPRPPSPAPPESPPAGPEPAPAEPARAGSFQAAAPPPPEAATGVIYRPGR
jgi:hypothetical protein